MLAPRHQKEGNYISRITEWPDLPEFQHARLTSAFSDQLEALAIQRLINSDPAERCFTEAVISGLGLKAECGVCRGQAIVDLPHLRTTL
jgi:hypothetical protein